VFFLFNYAWRYKPKELQQVFAADGKLKEALLLGLLSAINSGAIYIAVNLVNPAFVKAFMNLEVLHALVASVVIFSEVPPRREIIGVSLIMMSVFILTL
jgi:drug/metabolite transporter (DMT)-like permease